MSKDKKRMQEQILVNQAIASAKKQISDLEASRKKYIAAAVSARKNGIASQYNLAKNAIRIASAQRVVVEQMLLNLQISAQIKDVSEMTKSFADGMKILSGAITDTTGSLNFDKVSAQMNKAIVSTQIKQAEMDEFLDGTQSAFDSLSDGGGIGADDIDRLIDAEIGGASGLDADIEMLERKIKGATGEKA